MDRLTKRTEYNCACWNGNQEHTIRKRYLTLLEALAQYEDIGLTPDEIAALRAENDNLRDQLDHAGLVLDAYKKDIAALRAEVEQYRADIEAGRLVRLPCAIGSTVWVMASCEDVIKIQDNDYYTGTGASECPFEGSCVFYECKDENRQIFETAVRGVFLEEDQPAAILLDNLKADVTPKDFGETAFLTEVAARAALEGGAE